MKKTPKVQEERGNKRKEKTRVGRKKPTWERRKERKKDKNDGVF
jgi:hypothetical protein